MDLRGAYLMKRSSIVRYDLGFGRYVGGGGDTGRYIGGGVGGGVVVGVLCC